MPVETDDHGNIICTGDGVDLYRMLALRGALKLELVGLKRRGRSAHAICKEVYGLKGNKEKVLAGMEELIKKAQDKLKQVEVPLP